MGRGGFSERHGDPGFCDLAQVPGCSMDQSDFGQIKKLIEDARAEGGWLILVGHEVGDAGFQTTRTSALAELCAYATDEKNGLWIDTVAGIGEYVHKQRT